MDPLIRFMNKVEKTDTCWLWTAATWQGYGRFSYQYENVLAHKWLWEPLHGPHSRDRELDHLCRIRHCVNPDHLELVTHAENVQRGNGGMPPRTMCPKGHRYEGDNVYIRPDGRGRGCKTCRSKRN